MRKPHVLLPPTSRRQVASGDDLFLQHGRVVATW